MANHLNVPSSCLCVAPDQIRCAIDRDVICETACCPDGCEADRVRERLRPLKQPDLVLLPNIVTCQLDSSV